MYEIVKVGITAEDNQKNAAFLAEVFNDPKLFTEEYIKWQYADHPAGKIIGYNALNENEIAAHFVLQPFPAIINGVKRNGLLAFNSATKKEHQGKGLFLKLSKRTIDEVTADGYDFIVAVTNNNSVHPYTKHLGFQLVCQLKAKMGFGKIHFNDNENVRFEKFWDEKLLDWRLANPLNKYSFIDDNDKGYYSKTHLPLIKAFLLKPRSQDPSPQKDFGKRPFTLYIGLNKDVSFTGLFFKIPERLKPSPLFFVFRDLKDAKNKLDKERVKFNLIDFDAY